jgi:hypothetical protein
VYLSSLLDSKMLCAPVDGRHEYNLGTEWIYESSDASMLVSRALAQGQRVYCLAQPASNSERVLARAANFGGMRWRQLAQEASQYAAIWELLPDVGEVGER